MKTTTENNPLQAAPHAVQASRLAGRATTLIENAALMQAYVQLTSSLIDENHHLQEEILRLTTPTITGAIGQPDPRVPSVPRPVAGKNRTDAASVDDTGGKAVPDRNDVPF